MARGHRGLGLEREGCIRTRSRTARHPRVVQVLLALALARELDTASVLGPLARLLSPSHERGRRHNINRLLRPLQRAHHASGNIGVAVVVVVVRKPGDRVRILALLDLDLGQMEAGRGSVPVRVRLLLHRIPPLLRMGVDVAADVEDGRVGVRRSRSTCNLKTHSLPQRVYKSSSRA